MPTNALHTYFNKYKGQTVDFLANHGNIGDTLIFQGTVAFFEQLDIKLNLITSITKNNNSLLVVSGGGNLIDHYSVLPTWLLPRVQQATVVYDRVVILPHTIFGERTIAGLAAFSSCIDIFCRERYSYDFLADKFPTNQLYLSDDMAFHLDFSSLKQKGKDSLYVFRTDGEKTSIPIPENNIDLSEEFEIGKPYQHNYWELSYWKEFPIKLVEYINQFESVTTNRLHIGIASALLGKETTIYPNNYFKNKGIYEYSLSKMDHVTFIDKTE
ncbi:MAG: polysaccharide pyruvyl transferase family protein [Cyclobacteriaceae bacterium]